ncbi:LysR family transcriptional regulator [Paralcaligenes sp. KSB-10]|uniref:LysR family transcriptional regulator n=1 Tax=Paralcaligenes sp. KSB-10 TaxID=2901142 RepID=UPI001E365758|nr:LysR family transcriptional regulator [Paralcaligenes sp. KSB-10]UHL64525.1 LysR family transcriptional regulator [Paralcaligenes sp. KSB-10]
MVNPVHFDIQSLRVFLYAAQAGSLTKAAERSHMTLSALSKRISELEKTIGCTLFVRLPRGLALTPAGQNLADHAQNLLNSVNRMALDMNDYALGVRGHVRIWANTSSIIQFLPVDLAVLMEQHPGIRIILEEKISEDAINAVAHGIADIGIFADNTPSLSLEKRLYRHDQLVVLVPGSHPLAGRDIVDFADTLDYDFVGLTEGSSLLVRMHSAAAVLERALKLRVQVASFDAICRMIEAGLGIGVLPRGAVRQEILGAGLRAIPLSDGWASRTLWLGVRSAKELPAEALHVLNFLASRHATVQPEPQIEEQDAPE